VALRIQLPLAVAAALALANPAPVPARADLDLAGLARCIDESGAVFYGAHWCPFCRKQKEHFDGYAHLLPYVECYDGAKSDGMNRVCRKAGIKSFPTWVYPDGRTETGAKTPSALAAKTGCRGS
jgi:hypothetical protein